MALAISQTLQIIFSLGEVHVRCLFCCALCQAAEKNMCAFVCARQLSYTDIDSEVL